MQYARAGLSAQPGRYTTGVESMEKIGIPYVWQCEAAIRDVCTGDAISRDYPVCRACRAVAKSKLAAARMRRAYLRSR